MILGRVVVLNGWCLVESVPKARVVSLLHHLHKAPGEVFEIREVLHRLSKNGEPDIVCSVRGGRFPPPIDLIGSHGGHMTVGEGDIDPALMTGHDTTGRVIRRPSDVRHPSAGGVLSFAPRA